LSNKNESKKQILKSSSIIGGASFITILIGLVKVKALAVLLGPAGIGLMGLLTTLMASGSSLFGMGLATSGVRQLVVDGGTNEKFYLVKKALFTANFLLGILAFVFFILFSSQISEFLFKSSEQVYSVYVIGFGVFITLISSSQMALLQGLRKITELAKVKVISALLATVTGLLIVFNYDEQGIPFFIITLPLATGIIAYIYTKKLPKIEPIKFRLKQLKPQWHSMITFGFVFMLTGLMSTGCQLLVRYIINLELNIEAVGYFQASWAVSMTYIGFVLGAMGADYYPRLTQIIDEKDRSNQLANDQTEIAIIIAAPVLLGMLAFAPVVIQMLYSNEFTASIEILRWQVLGDVLKVIAWPIGFILLAKGKGKLFFCTELLWNMGYVLFIYLGVSVFGIEVTGYAFVFVYLIYLIVIYTVGVKINGFMWSQHNIMLIATLLLASTFLLFLSYISNVATMLVGSVFVFISSMLALHTLSKLGVKNSKLVKVMNAYNKLLCALHIK
jgi:O-antigen/teichoic acid export membrane protein